jgi:hypothetical protein
MRRLTMGFCPAHDTTVRMVPGSLCSFIADLTLTGAHHAVLHAIDAHLLTRLTFRGSRETFRGNFRLGRGATEGCYYDVLSSIKCRV